MKKEMESTPLKEDTPTAFAQVERTLDIKDENIVHIPYILNGELYRIEKQEGENVTVKCCHCPPDRVYRGSVRSTGNFHMHIKRRHPELLTRLHEMKVNAILNRRDRFVKKKKPKKTISLNPIKKLIKAEPGINENESDTPSVESFPLALKIKSAFHRHQLQQKEKQGQQNTQELEKESSEDLQLHHEHKLEKNEQNWQVNPFTHGAGQSCNDIEDELEKPLDLSLDNKIIQPLQKFAETPQENEEIHQGFVDHGKSTNSGYDCNVLEECSPPAYPSVSTLNNNYFECSAMPSHTQSYPVHHSSPKQSYEKTSSGPINMLTNSDVSYSQPYAAVSSPTLSTMSAASYQPGNHYDNSIKNEFYGFPYNEAIDLSMAKTASNVSSGIGLSYDEQNFNYSNNAGENRLRDEPFIQLLKSIQMSLNVIYGELRLRNQFEIAKFKFANPTFEHPF